MSALIAILEFDWTAEAAIDSAKLFAVGGVYDGATYSTSNITEIVDDGEATGRYRARFSDLPYGDYHLIAFAEGVGQKSERYTVFDNGGSVFTPWSEAKPLTLAEIASAAIQAGPSIPPLILDMSPLDIELPNTRSIAFGWPADSASIVASRKNALGNYVAASGSVVQMSSTSGDYEYQFQYHANDRPVVPSSVRYRFTDGMYTRYLTVNFKLPTTFLGRGLVVDAF